VSAFFFFWSPCKASGEATAIAKRTAKGIQQCLIVFTFPRILRIEVTPNANI
jgi:hypothetical protein